MKLIAEDHDQLAIFKVKGDIVTEYAEELLHEMKSRLNKNVRDFVFDLSESEFIDSRGLEILLEIQEIASEQLGQVRLAGIVENVSEILRITRLAARIENYETVDEAVKSLRISA